MKLVMNYLKQNMNTKSLLKIICVFSIVGLFISNHAFAQSQTTGQDGLESFNLFINTLLSLLSWLWIFLASIAGKLMTNDRVYGSVLHLDVSLWKLRNIMKNFANFTLVALVLTEIVKIAIGQSKEGVSKVFTNTLIAAVLIQASRFVMGAVIDVSNITVSAVGSFPRIFMQEDKEVTAGLQKFAEGFQPVSYEIGFANNEVIRQTAPALTTIEQDSLIQSILPNTNSVSGPLIFMGASIFRFNEYTDISKLELPNWKKIALSMSLKLLVIFFYTLALLFLVVANIIRIGFLWVFIVLSPIIVLYLTFLKKGSSGISQYFDIGSVLSAIFKPTIFVGYISLMLVVLVLVKSFFASNPSAEIGGATLVTSPDSSKLSMDGVGNVEIKGSILKDATSEGQSMFSDLFVFLLGILLMWQLVKLALADKGPIGKTMDSMGINAKLAEGAMSALPVMPGGFGIGAYRSAMQNQTKEVLRGAKINRDGRGGFSADLDQEGADQLEQKINNMTGTKSYWNNNKQGRTLQTIIEKSPERFWSESADIAKNIQGGLSLNNPEWMGYFQKWLEKSNENKNQFNGQTLKSTSEEHIKEFLNHKDNAKKFHEYMQGATFKGFTGSNGPQNYEDLKKITYGTNEKSE